MIKIKDRSYVFRIQVGHIEVLIDNTIDIPADFFAIDAMWSRNLIVNHYLEKTQ